MFVLFQIKGEFLWSVFRFIGSVVLAFVQCKRITHLQLARHVVCGKFTAVCFVYIVHLEHQT